VEFFENSDFGFGLKQTGRGEEENLRDSDLISRSPALRTGPSPRTAGNRGRPREQSRNTSAKIGVAVFPYASQIESRRGAAM
jgi:hypothetical protein